jgi:hypothetical protein
MFTPEQQLLLLTARSRFSEPQQLQELVSRQLDWEAVVSQARSHGVVPLVASALTEHCAESVPEAAMAQLRRTHQKFAQHSLQLTQELLAVLELLEDHGIDAIPYRGPVLADIAYGDVSHRQFTDIDLLLRRDQLVAAAEVLKTRGYERDFELESTTELTDSQETAYCLFSRDHPFCRAASNTMVELHWRVLDRRLPTRIELDTVWDRRSVATIAGQDMAVLSAEDRLLMASVHGTRHVWERLEWLVDIAELINSTDIDWETTLGRARQHNAERMFLLGPLVASDLLDVELPDVVYRAAENHGCLDDLKQSIFGVLFSTDPIDEASLQRMQFRALERPRDQLRLLLGWLCVPNRGEIELVSLPKSLVWLYTLVRPAQLLRVAARCERD